MKQLLLLILIVFLLNFCNSKSNYTVIPFINNPLISDINGIPKDSISPFFPKSLFYDTIKHKFDSFQLEFHVKERYYLLYKMKEPILSNFYLNKEIYRITIIRSFHKPIVIKITKNDNNNVYIEIKKINRNISFPFMKYLDTLDKNYFTFEMDKISKHKLNSKNQELFKKFNNTNYYIEEFNKEFLKKDKWDSLLLLIDTAHFWKTKPLADFNHFQIDGSTWIIEGHNKNGYQIKIIPSPLFNKNDLNFNAFDSKRYYVNIFQYVISLSNLKNEEIY